MTTTPSLVDIMTIISFLCLWSTTVIGFVWWLNNKFNNLLPSKDFQDQHEELMERVRLAELKLAKLCQKVFNGHQTR